MSHTISGSAQSGDFCYFRQLWDLLLDPEIDMGTKLERLFERETAEFGMDVAFLARIDRAAETEHFEVVHGPSDIVEAGDTAPLAVTYCRETVADPDGTMSVRDAVEEDWESDPAYETFGFKSYLGTVVTLEDELYGTLCFADTDRREAEFTDEEIAMVEMLGQWVSYELNQWTGPPTQETSGQDLDDRSVPLSPQIDAMMEALGKRPRRYVLMLLLDDESEDGIDVFQSVEDHETALVKLRHAHLPKLQEAGYIDWDRETDRISEGPNFSEIEPLLRLLKDYTDEFSTQ